MAESAKRHEENSNIIKQIRASTDAAIRNQGASIKTLEIDVCGLDMVLELREFMAMVVVHGGESGGDMVLMAMASEQSSLELVLHEMTPIKPSSGIVSNPPLSVPFVPPSSVAFPVPVEKAPAPVESTNSPSSTTIDQDAPSYIYQGKPLPKKRCTLTKYLTNHFTITILKNSSLC
ncbi:hypothetical protein Tco_1453921 [Tanacetum coccineum]